jgi:serine/threonine-protein kinase
MFMEEARLAALINHPNVVRIYDVGQFEGSYYMAMEFIDGPSLGVISRHARRQGRGLPYPVAAEIVAQACDGLHAAHDLVDETGRTLHLVHRDVSPHNLMIGQRGLVKLVDFGIAKAQDTAVKTHTGKIKGKYPYMSPEQCRGAPLDRRTDIFSLGIVFYELVVGKRLFERSTDLMVLKAITEEPVPDPREAQPGLPAEICSIILSALQRAPDDRYGDAEQMGRAVRSAMTQLEVQSSPKLLATYLKANFSDLLDSREEAISQILALKVTGQTPPVVGGLDEGSLSTTGDVGYASEHPTPSLPSKRGKPGSLTRRIVLASVAVVLLAAAAGFIYRYLTTPASPEGPPLLFGLPPTYPAEVGQKELRPFLRYLETKLQRPVKLVISKDYRTLRSMLVRDEVHLANLPALSYVIARAKTPRLRALVTHTYEGAWTYQSYLITRYTSQISSIADLRGKRFCFADPESTSGYLLPRHFLRRRGLDPDKLFSQVRFSGNHLSVLKDVVAGRCDGGAVYSGAWLSASNLGVASSRLQLLVAVGKVPYDVICVSP